MGINNSAKKFCGKMEEKWDSKRGWEWVTSVDNKSINGPWILSCRKEEMKRKSVEQTIIKI